MASSYDDRSESNVSGNVMSRSSSVSSLTSCVNRPDFDEIPTLKQNIVVLRIYERNLQVASQVS